MASVLNDHDLFVHVSDRCKPSYHPILTVEFSLESDPSREIYPRVNVFIFRICRMILRLLQCGRLS